MLPGTVGGRAVCTKRTEDPAWCRRNPGTASSKAGSCRRHGKPWKTRFREAASCGWTPASWWATRKTGCGELENLAPTWQNVSFFSSSLAQIKKWACAFIPDNVFSLRHDVRLNDIQHYNKWNATHNRLLFAECRLCCAANKLFMLNVVLPSLIMLCVVAPSSLILYWQLRLCRSRKWSIVKCLT